MADDAAHAPQSARSTDADELTRLFTLQKAAYAEDPFPSYDTRIANLNKIATLVEKYETRFINAINADFTHRCRYETIVGESVMTIAAVKNAKKNLKRWMRPRGVPTPIYMLPAKSKVTPQPLGVVGVISPWNYPMQLALTPAVAALAAGNRVMIKPSELTPQLSETLKEAIADFFDERQCAVVTGGAEIGQAFAETAFDHLLFTGSTKIGRIVAQSAAKNLTPVTLELGGKSPVIIDNSADINKAASSIAYGKLFNAGQTCIAPDYVLTPAGGAKDFADAVAEAARTLYPEIDATDDYSAIVSDRHFERLKSLVDEARTAGAQIIEVGSSNALHPQRKLPLTLVVDPPEELGIMKEEIFGPILPVAACASSDAAIERINAAPRPLALYWFGEDNAARDKVLERTVAGGVTVNDVMVHFAQENLPFGGVGESGHGAYHGDAGFATFSHLKPVFYQSKFASSGSLRPPYSEKTDKVLSVVRKIV